MTDIVRQGLAVVVEMPRMGLVATPPPQSEAETMRSILPADHP
jgi:hypothetical protein